MRQKNGFLHSEVLVALPPTSLQGQYSVVLHLAWMGGWCWARILSSTGSALVSAKTIVITPTMMTGTSATLRRMYVSILTVICPRCPVRTHGTRPWGDI